jgi:hypothetical protein
MSIAGDHCDGFVRADQVDGDDPRAFSREAPRDHAAKAGAGARDDCGSVGESHSGSSFGDA